MTGSVYGSGGVYGARPQSAPYYRWRASNVPPARGRLPSPVPEPRQIRNLKVPGLLRAALIAAESVYYLSGERPQRLRDPGYSITDMGGGVDRIRPYAFNIGTGPITPKTRGQPSYASTDSTFAFGVNRTRTTAAHFWVYTRIYDRPGTAATVLNPYLWPGNTQTPPKLRLLPVPGPAVGVASIPRSYPGPEPLPRPAMRPPAIRPGVGLDIPPNGPPVPVSVRPSRPPRNVREGKVGGKAAAAIATVANILDEASEVGDVMEIFWDHLERVTPGDERTFFDTMEMFMEDPSLWELVDWEGMIRDLIANEVEDAIVGRIHGLKRRLKSEWGTPTFGGAFQGP